MEVTSTKKPVFLNWEVELVRIIVCNVYFYLTALKYVLKINTNKPLALNFSKARQRLVTNSYILQTWQNDSLVLVLVPYCFLVCVEQEVFVSF
jgi:hypothetical protein